MEFQKLSTEALSSYYGRTNVFNQNPKLRLATAVVNRSDLISEVIAQKGHTFHFESSDIKNGSNQQRYSVDDEGLKAMDVAAIDLDDHDPKGTIKVRQVRDHLELEDLVHAPRILPEPRGGSIHGWLKGVYRDARGFELGTLNSTLLAVTMKRQSMKWKSLALGYIADIVTMAHTFVIDLLRMVCPVERVRTGIMSLLTGQLMEKYKAAISHVNFLLEIELDGTPATLNHYFNDNLEKW
ncbi:MAG: hypothetical protein Q9205_006764 [Flavoplaca limonia]